MVFLGCLKSKKQTKNDTVLKLSYCWIMFAIEHFAACNSAFVITKCHHYFVYYLKAMLRVFCWCNVELWTCDIVYIYDYQYYYY